MWHVPLRCLSNHNLQSDTYVIPWIDLAMPIFIHGCLSPTSSSWFLYIIVRTLAINKGWAETGA